ncbi:4a-hydroxytetrahydrobiopterin dehydratase [Phaeacidiphilus oryzae]|uniref:4a-hydroxytetrahydrobiopterin dehydratase n=1 Tax=Phaeacidiphilus oryzae TaxID=348818 RepID=UPI000562D161|nr:4a-hydroxytetrahydrobiopterin dehydratase [Phaeacidiphilus oryzae]
MTEEHPLSAEQLTERLADPRLHEWRHEDGALRRTVLAPDFTTAVRMLDQLVEDAARLHRTPNVAISGRTLDFSVAPPAGGSGSGTFSEEDVELCRRIEYAVGTRTGVE